MNRHQRYEQIPQRDEVIILDTINPPPSYNYNTALPTSVASSSNGGVYTPSIRSIPPPSFHSHSSPGTPRPSHCTTAPTAPHAELWGVAPSTVGGETLGTSNDALATVAGLKQRVEWLEESIGRLLLEKETSKDEDTNHKKYERDNCCVAFTDASPDLERALFSSSNGRNCCVSFSGNKTSEKRKEQRIALIITLVVFLVVCGLLTIIATSSKRNRRN